MATDGNFGTRWSSGWSDPQSLTIDLGESRTIGAVVLYWEFAFGKVYDIETADSVFLQNMYGNSKVMCTIGDRVRKVAQSEANVLIYGESGPGKELIAKNIHRLSKRNHNPFIPLDCVSLPSSLLESEIFGFEQGAFTGAIKSKPGVIELADGGTLFLDEIVELDTYLQTKLLRILQ